MTTRTTTAAAATATTSGTSGGKKTRTKPTRNSDGILIRKDGRPDMRSVSSANNLRKVHAKKEAERAEMGGRTPTSARSLAPATSNSLSSSEGTHSGSPESTAAGDGGCEQDEEEEEDEPEEEEGTQERHEALMRKIFPQGVDGPGLRGRAGDYFPRHERVERSGPNKVVMKMEEVDGARGGGKGEQNHREAEGRRDRETTDYAPPTRNGRWKPHDPSDEEWRPKEFHSAGQSPPENDRKPGGYD